MANSLMPQAGTSSIAPVEAGQTGSIPLDAPRTISSFLQGNRRLIIMAAAGLILAGLISLLMWTTKPAYQPLYAGMNEVDASQVVEFLDKEHIPYRLDGPGTVTVPADKVYSARLKLAGKSITPGNGMGFELFDKKDTFGLSDFTRHVNYQRALQGELARTIQTLPIIAAARVHLVMPKDSAFIDRERKASASIMLKLVGNQHLSRGSVTAIQNLVAASVPKLDRSAVVIVDSAGNLLSMEEGAGQNREMGGSQGLQEYQAGLEKRMEIRLTSMLEQIVGPGQAVVRVSTAIDRSQLEQDSQVYNPDEAVLRSEKTLQETRKSTKPQATGVPGFASNKPGANKGAVQGAPTPSSAPSENANRNERTANYEISKRTEHKVIPFGAIKKISIAVIVGGAFKDVKGEQVFVPRGKKEIKTLQGLVERAAGFNEDRGDVVEVQSLPLAGINTGTDNIAMEKAEKQAFYMEIARYSLVALALILIAWFLLRPISRGLMALRGPTQEKQKSNEAQMNPALSLMPQDSRQLSTLEKANFIISREPERAAAVIKEWVNESP